MHNFTHYSCFCTMYGFRSTVYYEKAPKLAFMDRWTGLIMFLEFWIFRLLIRSLKGQFGQWILLYSFIWTSGGDRISCEPRPCTKPIYHYYLSYTALYLALFWIPPPTTCFSANPGNVNVTSTLRYIYIRVWFPSPKRVCKMDGTL